MGGKNRKMMSSHGLDVGFVSSSRSPGLSMRHCSCRGLRLLVGREDATMTCSPVLLCLKSEAFRRVGARFCVPAPCVCVLSGEGWPEVPSSRASRVTPVAQGIQGASHLHSGKGVVNRDARSTFCGCLVSAVLLRVGRRPDPGMWHCAQA